MKMVKNVSCNTVRHRGDEKTYNSMNMSVTFRLLYNLKNSSNTRLPFRVAVSLLTASARENRTKSREFSSMSELSAHQGPSNDSCGDLSQSSQAFEDDSYSKGARHAET